MAFHLQVQEIWQKDQETLMVRWTGGEEMAFDVGELRLECPCASCRDELTGVRIYHPPATHKKVYPLEIESVGSYALRIVFDDGHSSGIYSFVNLYSLGKKPHTNSKLV